MAQLSWGQQAMRYLTILLGVLILACGAAAQEGSGTQFPLARLTTGASPSEVISNDKPVAAGGATPAGSIIPAAAPSSAASLTGLVSVAPSPGPEPASPPQAAVQVFEQYSWQVAADYVFSRFEAKSPVGKNYPYGIIVTGNYYFKDWFAAEGEFMGSGGADQQGIESHFVFAGGGPRFRWSLPRNLELFGHALVGHAHVGPQSSFGSTGAFAYVLGGGVDVNAHHRRFAYRFGADVIGSRFFSDNQFSPRVYAGFVFKF